MDIEHAIKDPLLCDTSRNVLANFINYLDTHHKHIEYHQFKAMGFPIGSGMVESAFGLWTNPAPISEMICAIKCIKALAFSRFLVS